MGILQVTHIEADCKRRFTGIIDLADLATIPPADKEKHFLTRSLSAFAIAALARVDDLTAAKSVVDQFGDGGIDAFFFDRVDRVCYLVQSKWDKNGTGSIDLASVLKFVRGINQFMENKVENLSPKLQLRKDEIREVLYDTNTKFILVICYTGKQPLADEVSKPMNELMVELNDGIEYASLRVFKQDDLHKVVSQSALGASVDLEIMLHEWGRTREPSPYESYYGQMNITDIEQWRKFGDHLYIKNIRGYKGSTDVNDAIVETLKGKPQDFLYFNNGITLLCSKIGKKPIGGQTRDSGVFACQGASVVNGAQTVGSILNYLASPQESPNTARVMVRIISLEKADPNLGVTVTKATNTQNRIENKDFAALDEEQSRLRMEMNLTLHKRYIYKTGEEPPDKPDGCTLDEATVALACAQPDISYAMSAKVSVGKLYEDVTKAPYTVLFNPLLSADKLWRAVLIARKVDESLERHRNTLTGRDRLIAVHGNRFILYLVFRALGESLFKSSSFESDLTQIDEAVSSILPKITAQIAREYSQSYPAVLFKNSRKCSAIAAALTETTAVEPAIA